MHLPEINIKCTESLEGQLMLDVSIKSYTRTVSRKLYVIAINNDRNLIRCGCGKWTWLMGACSSARQPLDNYMKLVMLENTHSDVRILFS